MEMHMQRIFLALILTTVTLTATAANTAYQNQVFVEHYFHALETATPQDDADFFADHHGIHDLSLNTQTIGTTQGIIKLDPRMMSMRAALSNFKVHIQNSIANNII